MIKCSPRHFVRNWISAIASEPARGRNVRNIRSNLADGEMMFGKNVLFSRKVVKGSTLIVICVAALLCPSANAASLHGANIMAQQLNKSVKSSLSYEAVLAFESGIKAFAQQKYGEAADEMKRSLAIEPEFADAKFSLGVIQEVQGNVQIALKYYDDALCTRTGDVEPLGVNIQRTEFVSEEDAAQLCSQARMMFADLAQKSAELVLGVQVSVLFCFSLLVGVRSSGKCTVYGIESARFFAYTLMSGMKVT